MIDNPEPPPDVSWVEFEEVDSRTAVLTWLAVLIVVVVIVVAICAVAVL